MRPGLTATGGMSSGLATLPRMRAPRQGMSPVEALGSAFVVAVVVAPVVLEGSAVGSVVLVGSAVGSVVLVGSAVGSVVGAEVAVSGVDGDSLGDDDSSPL